MKILILDNYDSFTYNLVHLVEKVLGDTVTVKFNDQITGEDALLFDRIVLSPGPGLPKEAGHMPQVISACVNQKPILGVCLGMQAIAEHFGAKLNNLRNVVHGQAKEIIVKPEAVLFKSLPHRFKVGRYHSWVVESNSLPPDILVTAKDEHGNVMALEHQSLPVMGVQFHPESILSECGEAMIRNWLQG